MRYIRKNPEWDDIKHKLTRMDGYDSKGKPFLGFPLPTNWSAWYNKETGEMFFAIPPELSGKNWQITQSFYDYDEFIKNLKRAVAISQHELGNRLARDRTNFDANVKQPFLFKRFLSKLTKQKTDIERGSEHDIVNLKKELELQRRKLHEQRDLERYKEYDRHYKTWDDQKEVKKNPKRKTRKKKITKKVVKKR